MKIILVVLLLTSCSKQKEDLINKIKVETNSYLQVKELPRCEDICSNDYRSLKGKNNDRDYLAFANFGYRGVGRCRGHAIVNQKVYELTNFKNDSKLDCNTKKLSQDCREIISEKLSRLMSFEVQNFPGFKNLYELSSHPEIKEMLKSYVRGISHRYKAGRGSVRDNSYPTYKESVFNEILLRVKENQRPYIGIKGESVGHHAVIAHSDDFKAGAPVICVHDSNIIFHEEADQCHNYIYMKNDSVYYKRYRKDETNLYTFSLTNDEDRRVTKYVQARYAHCVSSNRSEKLCK